MIDRIKQVFVCQTYFSSRTLQLLNTPINISENLKAISTSRTDLWLASKSSAASSSQINTAVIPTLSVCALLAAKPTLSKHWTHWPTLCFVLYNYSQQKISNSKTYIQQFLDKIECSWVQYQQSVALVRRTSFRQTCRDTAPTRPLCSLCLWTCERGNGKPRLQHPAHGDTAVNKDKLSTQRSQASAKQRRYATFQGRTQEGLTGLKPPEMLNILGVFSCLV